MNRTPSIPLAYSDFLTPSARGASFFTEPSSFPPEESSQPMSDESGSEDPLDHSCWRGYWSDEGPFDDPCDPIDDLIEVDSE